MSRGPLLVAAPDKFRGTATATEVAAAIADAAGSAGWRCDAQPLSDGGEGFLDCLGGANRLTEVTGPAGATVFAPWRLDGRHATIEMATASGLALVRGRNDPVRATSTGTGQLIAAAIAAGATDILVGVGGSASTDGGLGALEPLRALLPLDGSRGYLVTVAADVDTVFLDSAAVFAPQKGADPSQVQLLTERLRSALDRYRTEFGRDIAALPGSGAAGGLAGGLAAAGATLRPGIQVVAERTDLEARLAAADLVLTGEGRLDATTSLGKVPAAVVAMCRERSVPVELIVGSVAPGLPLPAPTTALDARFGRKAALARTAECIRLATLEVLRGHPSSARSGDR